MKILDLFLKCVIGQKEWANSFERTDNEPANFWDQVSQSDLAFVLHILESHSEEWTKQQESKAAGTTVKMTKISKSTRDANYLKWGMPILTFRKEKDQEFNEMYANHRKEENLKNSLSLDKSKTILAPAPVDEVEETAGVLGTLEMEYCIGDLAEKEMTAV